MPALSRLTIEVAAGLGTALTLLLLACGTVPVERKPEPARCDRDSDCVATAYVDPVLRTEECYCPGCPVPRTLEEDRRNREGWERFCGSSWTLQAECRHPDCARPVGAIGCRDHRCVRVVAP